MKRRTVFSPVERAARALAAEILVEVAIEMDDKAKGLKAAAYRAQRNGCGPTDFQRHLALCEAFSSADIHLRMKAVGLTGKPTTRRARHTEPDGLFDLGAAS